MVASGTFPEATNTETGEAVCGRDLTPAPDVGGLLHDLAVGQHLLQFGDAPPVAICTNTIMFCKKNF